MPMPTPIAEADDRSRHPMTDFRIGVGSSVFGIGARTSVIGIGIGIGLGIGLGIGIGARTSALASHREAVDTTSPFVCGYAARTLR